MVQPPVSSSPFHKIIEAITKIKSKIALSALNLVLLFLAFVFVLFLMSGWERLLLAILALIFWGIFTIYALVRARQNGDSDK